MITLTYRDLAKPPFISGMKKLAACSDFATYQTLYAVGRLVDAVQRELDTKAGLYKEMVRRLQVGERTLHAQELEEESDKFLAVEVQIDRPKLKLAEIFPAKLAAIEISVLLPCLEDEV